MYRKSPPLWENLVVGAVAAALYALLIASVVSVVVLTLMAWGVV